MQINFLLLLVLNADLCINELVGEPQEEGMMSTAASFPQYETKVINPVGATKHPKGVAS